MPRSGYLLCVFFWVVIGAFIFLARRVGAMPFPDLMFVVFAAIYFFGALWIVRQRHQGSGVFARLALVALVATGVVAIGHYLMPDSYPYTFTTRPDWYVEMIDILFFICAGCPPLFLLLGGLLPADTNRIAS